MTPAVLTSRAARGVRTYRHGSRPSASQCPDVHVDTTTADNASYEAREDDLNYYYQQVETFWLAGMNTTAERIRDRLPPTQRPDMTDALAALVARKWLNLQELPASTHEQPANYEKCYVPVRPTHARPSV